MTQMLVVAKAPVPGLVKTRLGADVGMQQAAELASAALLDTLVACSDAVGPERCHLSLAGDLDDAVDGERLRRHLSGWGVRAQRGEGFAERLVNAHLDLTGPVVQVGMDTPQLTPELLLEVGRGLSRHDAVLGDAVDGGWWVLALRDPGAARALVGVPMSTPSTYDDTRAALVATGLGVGTTRTLADVDTVHDARAVAAAAPGTRFARAWADATRAELADEGGARS